MASLDSFSVLIPDGESPQALGVLRCLAQIKNIKIYILSKRSWPLIRFSRYSKYFFSYKTDKGNEGRIAAILDSVRKTKADVVLPADTRAISLLSANREAFSAITCLAPLPEAEAFKTASNKWLLAEWLNKNQVLCPSTILYQPNNSFDALLSDMSFPVLIKPAVGSSGRGIKQFDDPETLFSFARGNINSGEFIVQSFINGYDIDCSALCQEGEILAYTIQKTFKSGPRRFGVASGIDFLYDESTYNLVKDMIRKMNWTGIVHIDLRYDEKDKQVKVIEMNPRYWGSLIGSLYAGVNFPYLACLTALKHDLPKMAAQPKRFVKGSLAIQIMLKRLLHRNKKDQYFDNSEIGFIIKDPLPRIVQGCSEIYSRFLHRR